VAAVAILAVIALFVLLILFGYARPEFPPLQTEPGDPLLLEARQQARSSLPELRRLIVQYPKNAVLKLTFVSNTDQVEYLWAEVLERREAEYQVRLVTPPVTHAGRLERLYICKEDDIEDWQVTDDAGKHYGGFSQRAMFKIARRDGVALPQKLREIEKLYQ
jgi:uncharacterized protein YegJ (DUF2314 family)